MSTIRTIGFVAAILIAISSVVSGVEPILVQQHALDSSVAQTMLADYQRVAGIYPLADGRLHPLRDALGAGLNDAAPCKAIDAWGHPLWYRANERSHQLISYGTDGRRDKDQG